MTNEELMRVAINEARKSKEPLKCGVVIAKDGKIISKSFNKQRLLHNATAHAEINAIGAAGNILGDKNLTDCVAFCTCEPCTMCLSAMIFSKVSRLYFGSTLKSAASGNLPIYLSSTELIKHSLSQIEIIEGLLKEECDELVHE